MSNKEDEVSSEGEGKSPTKVKHALMKMQDIKKMESNQILSYIENLHEQLQKNNKKLKKYKRKIKKLVRNLADVKAARKDSAESSKKVSSDKTGACAESVNDKESVPAKKDVALSLVDDIRQAAEQAQNLNGFVYEPTSGLYYDQKTGYYYNAEYGLYYDGNTGCYYKYDQEKNEFEFHSRVSVTQTSAAATTTTKNSTERNHFDNYTIVADDNNVEWDVISRRRKACNRVTSPPPPKKRKRKRREKASKRKEKSSKRREEESDDDASDTTQRNRLRRKRIERTNNKTATATTAHDMEDGELNSSQNSSSSSNDSDSSQTPTDGDEDAIEIFNRGSKFQDIAKKYPPSLRIIVLESEQEKLKVGSLSLITFKGGTLGREGNHDVIIPDVNVSKFHLKFIYDTKEYIYKCIDLGSRNGTILNGARMSVSKVESDPHDLVHGSVLQLGQTKLLCHVHEGNSTCGQCEPGLLIEATATKEAAATSTATVRTHKEQLKTLQKKYGLENEKFVENKPILGSNYNDRAATRRCTVGSTTEGEKVAVASVNVPISSENKGFKMLAKLGWSKGEALGKASGDGSSAGLLEPINVSSNIGKAGLGCEEAVASAPVLTLAAKIKLTNLKKTQERYRKADIFQDSDADSN